MNDANHKHKVEAAKSKVSAYEPRAKQGSYYDVDGDPFDPDNEANWDGDQQVGFRD